MKLIKKQGNLLYSILEFSNKAKLNQKQTQRKKDTFDSAYALYEGRGWTLNAF